MNKASQRYMGMVLAVVVALSSGCAQLLMTRGEVLLSKTQYAEARDVLEPEWKANPNMSFRDYMSLCWSLQKLKEFDKFFRCIDGMQARIAAGDDAYFGFAYRELPYLLSSEAYIETNDYPKAIESAQTALRITEEEGGLQATAKTVEGWGLLGLAYALRGDEANADKILKNLREIYLGYPYNVAQKPRDAAVARISLALHRYQDAVEAMSNTYPFWEFAKAISAVAAGAPPSMFLVIDLPPTFVKCRALFEVGRIQEAKKEYDKLLAMEQIASSGTIYWNILYDRGRIAEKEGAVVEAVGFYSKAVEVIEVQRASIGSEASKIGFVSDKQAVYARLIGALVSQGKFAEALAYVERGKSRALVDLLAQRTTFATQALSTEQIDATLRQLASLEVAYEQIDERRTVEGRERQRSVLHAELQSLRTQAPELASLVTVSAERLDAIQGMLAPGEVVLEYYAHGDVLYVFAVDRTSIAAATLDAAGLDADVRALRAALQDPGGNPAQLAEALYARLVAPMEPQLASASLLTVVPHGLLHYLPFGVLSHGEPLLARMPVRTLPSASVLRFLRKSGEAGQQMLVLGNPDLGNPQYDLPGAGDEAMAIKANRPEATVLLREAASETHMKETGGLFSMIHIAAHGQFMPDDPLQSRVLLAPDKDNDGYLTAGELYDLRLNADLVTLSACSTGLGTTAAGDDVIGLTRGFLYAGANALVTTLWQVADAETAFLMTEFYKNLREMPTAEALRQAQLALRARAPHPYYWAAFQLTGQAN
ncbi:MAG: CHAT domain-containing protein [Desulfovibrionaceae bacterium]